MKQRMMPRSLDASALGERCWITPCHTMGATQVTPEDTDTSRAALVKEGSSADNWRTIGRTSEGALAPFCCVLIVSSPIERKMSNMTRIAVDLPEDIAKRLESAWRDLSRGALEAVALEAYRDGTLGREQVGRLLGLSFWRPNPS